MKTENNRLKDTIKSQRRSPAKKAEKAKTEEVEDVRFRICADTLCTLVSNFLHAMR